MRGVLHLLRGGGVVLLALLLVGVRLLRGVVILVLTLGVVAVLGVFAGAWLLGQGPVDLGPVLPRVAAALNRAGASVRVGVDGATVEWRGFRAGAGAPVSLRLAGLVVRDGERVAARASGLGVELSLAGLVGMQGVTRSVEAAGLELHLLRGADGAVSLDLGDLDLGEGGGGGPDLAEVMQELARPPRPGGPGPVRAELAELRSLAHVRVTDSVVTVHDRGLGAVWRLQVPELVLDRPAAGGVVGRAEAKLALGASRAAVRLDASVMPDGGTGLRLTVAPVQAGAIQREGAALGAELGEAGVVEAAVEGSASLLLDAGLRPRSGALRLRAGGGRVRVAGTAIGFDRVEVDGTAEWAVPGWGRPSAVSVSRLQAVVHAPGGGWPTTVQARGTVRRDGEKVDGTAQASVDHLAFADVPRLWPEALGGHVRPWLARNITAGTVRDGSVSLSFGAVLGRAGKVTDFVLTGIDGSLVGEDVVIHWLRPVPPVERAQAVLTIRSPDVLDIAISGARQGGVALSNGTVRITGLSVKDQFLQLGADAQGTVAEVIALLRHPRVRLLDRKPIPMRNPGGAFTGRLGVFLPLNEDLDFDDVKITARARATELRLGGLVAGRDLERGDVVLEATSESLKATGRAAIAGLPTDLLVEMDFRGGPANQVVQRAQGTVRATPGQLAAAGFDSGGIVEGGVVGAVARFLQRRDGSGELAVSLDLKDAALNLAGWSKAPGAAAEASGRLLLRGEQMLGIDPIRARGPGLEVEGRAEMVGDRPLLLRLDRVLLGGTQGAGEVQLPGRSGEAIRVRLDGRVLDLSALLQRKPGGGTGAQAPWVADVRFDRVVLSGERFLPGVTARAESTGGRVAFLRASSTGPEKLQAAVDRVNGGRQVVVTAADGGAVLRAMDLVDSIQGGTMRLQAVYDDSRAEPPLRGTLELSGFRVRNAPALGKLLQAVTVYGVFEALSGPGLSFSALSLPFSWDGTVLEVADAQAFSASLGLTARGRVDAGRKAIDVQGTVVPLYVLNSMLGRIPLVGRLFSAEKGGGLLAVNYSLRGAVGDPVVSVNPLSALTPGFLRGLFRMLD